MSWVPTGAKIQRTRVPEIPNYVNGLVLRRCLIFQLDSRRAGSSGGANHHFAPGQPDRTHVCAIGEALSQRQAITQHPLHGALLTPALQRICVACTQQTCVLQFSMCIDAANKVSCALASQNSSYSWHQLLLANNATRARENLYATVRTYYSHVNLCLAAV
jgi:hypothetical protein